MRIYKPYGSEDLTVKLDNSSGLWAHLDKSLEPGTVVDVSRANVFARVWITETQVFVGYQNGHDRAWPHFVWIYDRQALLDDPNSDEVKPVGLDLHKFLADGYGIPPAPTLKA